MIESENNKKVKYFAKLKDKKYQDEENLFLIEGEHLVELAKEEGYLQEVLALLGTNYNYDNITYVSSSVLKKITSLNTPPKIIGIAKKIKPGKIRGRVLMLDRISNPGNLGTIIRSAYAFNIDTIVIGEESINLYNPKVVRATEGLIFKMNIVFGNLENIVRKLKLDDYRVYATDVNEGVDLKKEVFPEKSAIIVGNEGNGVDETLKKEADKLLNIKINKDCESLNVGVATSIILYELE